MTQDEPIRPSEVSPDVGLFDRLASWVSDNTARAWFFTACVLLVVLWLPTLAFLEVNTSQLIINTITTIVTFLLVALLQNTQARSNAAVQKKLNAIAKGLADQMTHLAMNADEPDECDALLRDVEELEAAVGLEKRESTN